MSDKTARRLLHLCALMTFAAIDAVWLQPILATLDTAVPGAQAGDNLTFVWNQWWMRHALQTHAPLFWSPAIFAPFGVSLALDTHTALPSLVAAVLMPHASPLVMTNLVVAVHLFLNFAVTYALAYRTTGRAPAAMLAAAIFGWSPYVGAHLAGHFNLIAAWVLPLAALAALRAFETRRLVDGTLLGVAIAVTIYVDYYYAIYSLVTIAVFVAGRSITLHRDSGRRPWQRGVLAALALLILLDTVVIVAVAITGGGVMEIGGLSISVRGAGNPLAAAWILALVAAGVEVLPSVRARIDAERLRHDAAACVPGVALAILCAAPLLAAVFRLWQQGDYVTQTYFWRSAPAGVDLGTLLLGNPSGALTGNLTSGWYQRLHINLVEQVAWLGPGVEALGIAALAMRRRDPLVRLWTAVAIVFGIWSLGPYVVAFGHGLRLPLPAALVRYLPVVANARIPARAIVMVFLAAAMLAAIGFAALRHSGRAGWAVALALLVVADYLPARSATYRVDRPRVYEVLRQQTAPGSVLDLPFGLRDGFGEIGAFDARALWYQTLHERPIAGGFVARLPPRIARAYGAAPALGSLLRLSAGGTAATETAVAAEGASAALRNAGFRFIVLDRRRASSDLAGYVARLSLTTLASDDERTLYEIR